MAGLAVKLQVLVLVLALVLSLAAAAEVKVSPGQARPQGRFLRGALSQGQAQAQAQAGPGLVDARPRPRFLKDMFAAQGITPRGQVLGMHMHDNVVRREALTTSCSLSTVSSTSRIMQPWDSLGNNLLELNFTNNCAYNVTGFARFSACDLTNADSTALVNPARSPTSCQGGATLFQVTVTWNGAVWTHDVCQLGMNIGNCNNPAQLVQIAAGQRIQLYYVDNVQNLVCNFNLTYASSPPTNYLRVPGSQPTCASDLTWTLPPGYQCDVTTDPSLTIYCPPVY